MLTGDVLSDRNEGVHLIVLSRIGLLVIQLSLHAVHGLDLGQGSFDHFDGFKLARFYFLTNFVSR